MRPTTLSSHLSLVTVSVAILVFLGLVGVFGFQPRDDAGCVVGQMVDYHNFFGYNAINGSNCYVDIPGNGRKRIKRGCIFALHAYRGDVAINIQRGRYTGGYFYTVANVGHCSK